MVTTETRFLTPTQMVTKKNMLSYAKSNGYEKACFPTPSQMVMGRRCEKNDLANFAQIFSNIYTVSQLFS